MGSPVATAASRAAYGLKGYGYHWEHNTMNSEEAAARMLALHEDIRDELTPSYILEVPEVSGLDVPALKRICRARNQLARLQRQGSSAIKDETQWQELAGAFRRP